MPCQNCALWKREDAQDAAGRVRKDRMAECLWRPAWAASIPDFERPKGPHYMRAAGGRDCPQFQERVRTTGCTEDAHHE